MKYLQDDRLSRLTTALTEVALGHSRVLHGRLECYSMKRVSSDKKYAAQLGEKYVEQIHQDQEELAAHQQQQQQATKESSGQPAHEAPRRARKRSQSAGVYQEATLSPTEVPSEEPLLAETVPLKKRARSYSFDDRVPRVLTALGDFNEHATRRLLTDLVLTLNASFPDYDFSSIKPSDFTKLTVPGTVRRVNKALAEWAALHARGDGPLGRIARGGRGSTSLGELWGAIDEAIRLNECDVYSFAPPTEDASFMTLDAVLIDEEDNDNAPPRQTLLWSFHYMLVNKQRKRIVLFTCGELMRQAISISDESEDHEVERFVRFTETANADSLDFEWDPEATAAGGIPVSIH